MYWKAVSHSSIGVLHHQKGMPCQDYSECRILEDGVIIGAVSDGAGSAKYSDKGSQLVVKTTLDYFSKINKIIQKRKKLQRKTHLHFCQLEAQRLFTKLVQEKLIERLQEKARQEGYSLQELACTLLCFIATPNWIAGMQIGDGFLVIRLAEENYELLFTPDKGEYANETTFVTSANALEDMQVRFILKPLEFICAATDGLERVALRVTVPGI